MAKISNEKMSGGVAHKLPQDFKKVLLSNKKVLTAWEDITPLARNDWICWIISPKKKETRDEHIKRAIEELKEGKRRPCCWMGCVHRKDKPMSPSQKFAMSRKSKK